MSNNKYSYEINKYIFKYNPDKGDYRVVRQDCSSVFSFVGVFALQL